MGILCEYFERCRRDGNEGNAGEKDASRYDRGFRRSDFCELPRSKNCSILHQGTVETTMYDSISKYGLYRYFFGLRSTKKGTKSNNFHIRYACRISIILIRFCNTFVVLEFYYILYSTRKNNGDFDNYC